MNSEILLFLPQKRVDIYGSYTAKYVMKVTRPDLQLRPVRRACSGVDAQSEWLQISRL
jgi:hypothetical protein